ncbi:MAG: L,D-transpeptidase family protein [bacterium]|nr:L,D-transpeptidase family protein [bacterium]
MSFMLLAALAGLAAPIQAAAPISPTLAPGGYRWLDEGPWGGPIYMVISIERQMVHVYSGDTLIAMASVSTGKKGHGTPKGAFPILQKRQWHRSNIYSNAPMPFMQRLTWDGIALHAGHNPGYPASHGCIRLPYAFAQKLFGITQIGTLVEVTGNRLDPALMVDTLVLSDPDTTVVTFAPRVGPPPRQAPTPLLHDEEDGAPVLDIDPAIFELRLSRR